MKLVLCLVTIAARSINSSPQEFEAYCGAARMFCDETSRHQDYYEVMHEQLPLQGRLLVLHGKLRNKEITGTDCRRQQTALRTKFIQSVTSRFENEERFDQLLNQIRLRLRQFDRIPTETKLTSVKLQDAVRILGPEAAYEIFGEPWKPNRKDMATLPNGRRQRQCKHVPEGFDRDKLLAHFKKIQQELEHYRSTHVNPQAVEMQVIRLKFREPLYREIALAMSIEIDDVSSARLGRTNFHDPKAGHLHGYVQEIVDNDTFLLKPRRSEAIFVHLYDDTKDTKPMKKLVGYEVRCRCILQGDRNVAKHLKEKSPPTGFIAYEIIPGHKRQNLANDVLQGRSARGRN